MIHVIIQKGKSIGSTDKVELRTFDTEEQAQGFCEMNTELNKKYWTYCEIIELNKEIDLFYNDGSEY